jgi:hypothetical protein
MSWTGQRVARRYLLKEIEEELKDFDRVTSPLRREGPPHAGAVFNAKKNIDEILNLFQEMGAPKLIPKLDRTLGITRNFWDAHYRKESSNEWMEDTRLYLIGGGEYNAPGFSDKAREWLKEVEEVLEGTKPTIIEGIRVRNVTGYPEAIDDAKKIISAAAKLLKRKGQTQVLRSDIQLVNRDQMPSAQRGHAGAMYRHSKDDILMVWPSPDSRRLAERLLHEFGHRLWFKLLMPDHQRLWEESWQRTKDNSGKFVTTYAGTTPHEDFAEVFAYWLAGKSLGPHLDRLKEIDVA